MGQDKCLMPFGGAPTLTHYQFEKFGAIFKNVFISAKLDKFDPPLRIIKDTNLSCIIKQKPNLSKIYDEADNPSANPKRKKDADFSPMLAIFSILSNFDSGHIFIIPADMPFVSFECVKRLYEFTDIFDMVVPTDSFHTHSLCGFFSVKLANVAREIYESGEHKIELLQSRCKCKKVGFDNAQEFFNINYFSDYEIATKVKI
ncbi:MAG: NTP transferase domain-containing protein [Campylobacter sp.]|nr:NTP transferase domain-containing protein [Campylobacter sp.]